MTLEWKREPALKVNSTIFVFVHGYNSNTNDCWTNKNKESWMDILFNEKEFERCGICSYSYITGYEAGDIGLRDIEKDLFHELHHNGVLNANRLIFVAHSLGGLVVRKFLVERKNVLLEEYIEIGLVLLASPSQGSLLANLLSLFFNFMSNFGILSKNEQLNILKISETNTDLRILNEEFLEVLFRHRLPIYGIELLEHSFEYFPSFFNSKRVVTRASAGSFFGGAEIVPGSTHTSIAKPDPKSELKYAAFQHKRLCDFAREFLGSGEHADKAHNIHDDDFAIKINKCKLAVKFGSISNEIPGRNVVFAFSCTEFFKDNDFFDTRSAFYKFISKYSPNIHDDRRWQENIIDHIERECFHQFSSKFSKPRHESIIDFESTSDISYGAGKCLIIRNFLEINNINIALLSTSTQINGGGVETRIFNLFTCMNDLFNKMAERDMDYLILPVIGSGNGNIDHSLALVSLLISVSEVVRHGHGNQRPANVDIIVYQPDKISKPEIRPRLIRRALALLRE